MKILVSENHKLLTVGLIKLLSYEHDIEIIGIAHSAHETYNKLQRVKTDLLVIDYHLEDENGLLVAQNTRKLYPDLKSILLSNREEASIIKAVLQDETDGYILKKKYSSDLMKAIKAVRDDKVYISADINLYSV